MGLLTGAVNGAWWLAAERHRAAWLRAASDPAAAQSKVLHRILRHNRDSEFGRSYSFAAVPSPEAFGARVPLSRYEDYAETMRRIGDGVTGLLTTEPVRLIQPSSGSASPSKWIPYTSSLQREFSRAIGAWVAQLFRCHPRAAAGPAYWSVSPLVSLGVKPTAVPFGFETDSSYLGGAASWLVESILAVPGSVRHLEDLETCRYVTLFHLLRSWDLALISVWSPTFLELLVEGLADWGERLAADVAAGVPNPPRLHAPAEDHRFRTMVRRSKEILAALREPDPASIHRRLWPGLAVISAWADGPSEKYADRLAGLFPHAELQPKGLVATEGISSIPFEVEGEEGSALTLTSHYLEFVPEGEAAAVPAHRLDRGALYEVVLTTGGGLYRYLTGDLVQVVGSHDRCPRVRFIGKRDLIADRFGEKLSEPHVRMVVEGAMEREGLAFRFGLLALEEGPPSAYVLHLESDAVGKELDRVARLVESGLMENPHYAYCRALDQLSPLQIHAVKGDGWRRFVRRRVREGRREGEIKPTWLSRRSGWCETFAENGACFPHTAS